MSNDYMSMFIDETREHLQAWSDGMMAMEKTGDSSSVAVLFRAAHTIKGMAMTMGFTRMGEITHAAENLLDGVRNGSLPLSQALFDVLLKSLDTLEVLLDSIETTGQESPLPTQAILQALKAVSERNSAQSEVSSASTAAPLLERPVSKHDYIVEEDMIRKVADQAISLGYSVFEILLGFEEDCLMPLARFAQWMQRIDLNLLLYTSPDAATIEQGEYKGDILVVLASTQDVESVGRSLADVSEIVIRSFSEWSKRSADVQIERRDLLPQDRHITDDPHVRHVITNALLQGIHVYEVGILLSETCQMKTARCFVLFDAIGGQNHLLYTDPSVEKIEQEDMGRQLLFIMWTKEELPTVQSCIQAVSEIELVELREWRQNGVDAVRGENQVQISNVKANAVQDRKRVNTIRVDTEKLDDLMNLVSELAIDKTRLERIRTEVSHPGLSETVDHMSRLSSQLQELIMSIRMVPVETVFHRFPRMVRDTANQLDKQVEFVMTGQDTELDRIVVEEIGDPIMHMLRNSLDHGIETPMERTNQGKSQTGRIELRAYSSGNHVFIEVQDDGRGISRDKVFRKAVERGLISSSDNLTDHQVHQLLFASGFSTADQVSDLSGRGVGLDVVKSKIEALSGKVDIYSELGKGSRFVIRLPMTLAIMDGLLIRIGPHPYLLPIGSIAETGRLPEPQTIHGKEVVIWRNRIVPIIRARTLFGHEDAEEESQFVVFVSRGDKMVGIVVEELIGQFEVVLKTLDTQLKKIPYFAGATILGDGNVSLILDSNAFLEQQS